MDCPEARELLGDELDGRLAPDAAARLADHVSRCAACAQERRELAALRATFRAMPRAAAPAGFKDGVMAALPQGRVRVFPRVAGWIAAVAAVVVLSVTVLRSERTVVERDVAAAPPAGARMSRDEAGAPAPELAVREKAEPVAPPRPDAPSAPRARGGAPAKESAGDESRDGKPGDGFAKAPAEGTAAAPPPGAPPAPLVPSDAPAPGADTALLESERQSAGDVRYVVFTDAAAAQKFADELAASESSREKDKSKLDDDAKGLAQSAAPPAAKTAAKPVEKADAKKRAGERDLLKEAAFRSRRVISRTTLSEALPESDLTARAALVGGALLPASQTAKFTELLDAPPSDAEKREEPTAATARKAKPAAAPPVGGKSAGRVEPPPPVVVVIVVLETPAPPGGEKR